MHLMSSHSYIHPLFTVFLIIKINYIYQTDLLIYISIKCADNKNPSVRMTLNISFGFEHMQYEEQTVKDHQSTSEHSIPVQK